MSKPKTVVNGILTGTGATLALAKADLNAKITDALHGSYEPTIVTHGAYIAVIYRAPEGWLYSIQNLSEVSKPGLHMMRCSQGLDDRSACFQAASSHVLDLGSLPDEFHVDSDIPSYLVDSEKRSTLLSNARFRRAYYHARENGHGATDHEWHRWACDHQSDLCFV